MESLHLSLNSVNLQSFLKEMLVWTKGNRKNESSDGMRRFEAVFLTCGNLYAVDRSLCIRMWKMDNWSESLWIRVYSHFWRGLEESPSEVSDCKMYHQAWYMWLCAGLPRLDRRVIKTQNRNLWKEKKHEKINKQPNKQTNETKTKISEFSIASRERRLQKVNVL